MNETHQWIQGYPISLLFTDSHLKTDQMVEDLDYNPIYPVNSSKCF